MKPAYGLANFRKYSCWTWTWTSALASEVESEWEWESATTTTTQILSRDYLFRLVAPTANQQTVRCSDGGQSEWRFFPSRLFSLNTALTSEIILIMVNQAAEDKLYVIVYYNWIRFRAREREREREQDRSDEIWSSNSCYHDCNCSPCWTSWCWSTFNASVANTACSQHTQVRYEEEKIIPPFRTSLKPIKASEMKDNKGKERKVKKWNGHIGHNENSTNVSFSPHKLAQIKTLTIALVQPQRVAGKPEMWFTRNYSPTSFLSFSLMFNFNEMDSLVRF